MKQQQGAGKTSVNVGRLILEIVQGNAVFPTGCKSPEIWRNGRVMVLADGCQCSEVRKRPRWSRLCHYTRVSDDSFSITPFRRSEILLLLAPLRNTMVMSTSQCFREQV